MGKLAKLSFKAVALAVVAGLGLAGSARAASPQITLYVGNTAVTGNVPGLVFDTTSQKYDFNGNSSYVYVNASGAYIGSSTTTTPKNQQFQGQDWKYEFHVEVTDNSPGLQTGALLFDTTHEIRSNGGGSPQTVSIALTDSTYTLPTGSVYLESVISGTLGNKNQANTFQSTYTGSAGTISTPSQVITSATNTKDSANFNNTGGFTLQNTVTLYLNGGEDSVAHGQTYLLPASGPNVSPVPEPATMALALSGLGVVGLAGLRRRRRAVAA